MWKSIITWNIRQMCVCLNVRMFDIFLELLTRPSVFFKKLRNVWDSQFLNLHKYTNFKLTFLKFQNEISSLKL